MSKDHNPVNAPMRIVGGQLLEARRASLAGQASAPHRLEPVASINDVLYINDSRSTFLDSSLEAFSALDQRVIWVCGTWNEDMTEGPVQQLLQERVVAVVLFGIDGSTIDTMPTSGVFVADDVRVAVFLARELARPGEVVLFSPACPSGNGYANYEERGAEFKRAVRDL